MFARNQSQSMVPGAAALEFVVPIIVRTTSQVSSSGPSTTITRARPSPWRWSAAVPEAVRALVAGAPVPMVVDGDGLSALATAGPSTSARALDAGCFDVRLGNAVSGPFGAFLGSENLRQKLFFQDPLIKAVVGVK